MADSDSIKLCECGCGHPAPIASKTLSARGWVRGQPIRFVSGHHLPHVRRHVTHGMTKTPEFRAWTALRNRCNNPRNPGWKNYGGRGIRVCERWQSFENFLADMGPRPSAKHSIERIDNNGNYEPSNCIWATDAVQKNNQRRSVRITYNGKTMTLTQWAKSLGLKRPLLSRRYHQGQRPPELFAVPRAYKRRATGPKNESPV